MRTKRTRMPKRAAVTYVVKPSTGSRASLCLQDSTAHNEGPVSSLCLLPGCLPARFEHPSSKSRPKLHSLLKSSHFVSAGSWRGRVPADLVAAQTEGPTGERARAPCLASQLQAAAVQLPARGSSQSAPGAGRG